MKAKLKRLGVSRITVMSTMAVLLLALFALVLTSKGQDQPPSQAGSASMHAKMMQQCQDSMKECQDTMNRLRQARDSNDPAKMRAAIDDALKSCAKMSGNMSKMTNMMQMQGMHSGMMHQGMMGGPANQQGGNQK